MKLYSYWRSSCSWRVRIALAYKRQEYEYHAVHLVQDGGHQHKEEHIAKNPMRQVPSLVLNDGTILNQSLSIIQFLESTIPSPNLLGTNSKEQALIWELAEIINAGTQPLQNLSVLQYVDREYNIDKLAWGRHFITIGLDALESRVKTFGYDFCARNTVSLSDLCLIPQLYNARRFSCDMGRWPALLEIEDRCEQTPEFIQAHPNQQPDAVH